MRLEDGEVSPFANTEDDDAEEFDFGNDDSRDCSLDCQMSLQSSFQDYTADFSSNLRLHHYQLILLHLLEVGRKHVVVNLIILLHLDFVQ